MNSFFRRCAGYCRISSLNGFISSETGGPRGQSELKPRAMHRLFVGLRPPPAIRARLLALMGGVTGARWQDDSQLHLTLRFIGEVERPRAEDIATALSNVHF